MTFIEMMVAVGLGTLLSAASIYTLMFTMRSYQVLTNYQGMNKASRTALDVLSADVRQASGCKTNATYSSSSVTLTGINAVSLAPYTIRYNYNTNATTLTRTYTESTNADVRVLLTNLTSFAFSYYQRNPTNAAYEVFTNSLSAAVCKVIQVDWNCSRSILGTETNIQSGQSARIVIRKG